MAVTNNLRSVNNYAVHYYVTSSTATSWAIGTAGWNQTYINNSTPTAITITIPAYDAIGDDKEIRVCFKAGTNCTFTPTINSGFTTQYGISDISITAGNTYEISFVPITSTTIGVICKEWS